MVDEDRSWVEQLTGGTVARSEQPARPLARVGTP
jgi:hypothetical protein